MTPWEIATALLEALEASFDAAGAPCVRNYVSDGSVVFDFDETLAVEWERNEPYPRVGDESASTPADFSSGIIAMQSVFNIIVMRHTPWPDEVGTPPKPSVLQANAAIVHADALRVLTTLSDGIKNGTLFGPCAQVTLYSQQMFGPDGGTVGSTTRIAVA